MKALPTIRSGIQVCYILMLIAFAQATYWTLNLFLHDASGWATRTLSPANRIQQPPGLSFDNGGLLHALGVRPGEGLNHVTIDTSWNVVNSTTVDTYSGFGNIALKINTAGLMHTFYSSTNPINGISSGVEYMWIAPNGSNKFYILANGAYMARALDQDTFGNLHALYYDKDRGDLVYALIEYNPKPMSVTATSPANNAIDIPINSTVTATFSEAMNSSTITTSTFFLTNGSELVAGSVNYNADSRTATFTPSAKLNDSKTYTATITNGVQSLAGKPLLTTKTWSFTTATPKNNLSVTISGPGSVNSNPSGIACTKGICTSAITASSAFTLMATPNTRSMFMGWSGACTNSSGDCILTMNSDKEVTANFAVIPPVRIAGTPPIYHKTLQEAYDAATSGSVIQAVEEELPGSSFILDLDKIILLTGGYDINYSVKSGFSTTNGIMIIQSGTLTIENLIIK